MLSDGMQVSFQCRSYLFDVRMDFMFTFNKYLFLFLMMGYSIEPDPNEYEARTDVGLVRGHAYSLTKVEISGGDGDDSVDGADGEGPH